MHRPRPSAYWRNNIIWIIYLLLLWAGIAIGGGVLWVKPLNRFRIGQLPLGFWISQQGAIIAFVGLVFTYAIIMDRLDSKHAADKKNNAQ